MSCAQCVRGVHGVHSVLIASVHIKYESVHSVHGVHKREIDLKLFRVGAHFVHYQTFLGQKWCTLLISTLLDMIYKQNVIRVLKKSQWLIVCITIEKVCTHFRYVFYCVHTLITTINVYIFYTLSHTLTSFIIMIIIKAG
jgi:hypothetical protein